jgi:haloacetate dehalogenase
MQRIIHSEQWPLISSRSCASLATSNSTWWATTEEGAPRIAWRVLDIVPTYDMFMQVNHHIARAYWHWYFLQNPAPFLEGLIGAAPDTFYEHCLAGWGATRLDAFDGAMLDEYRRCWRTREFIHGSSSDYRAAATVDLELDAQDLRRKVECPALALWGTQGHMHRLFDLQSLWKARCSHLRTETLPAGHFLVDQMPAETVDAIRRFLR